MRKYDYEKAMIQDIKEYIENEKSYTIEELEENREEIEQELNDELWTVDSVTGNASGSYTFCRVTAKEYVLENLDLLNDAADCFGIEPNTISDKFLSEDWEYFDVTIRCYMLSIALSIALDEIEEDAA